MDNVGEVRREWLAGVRRVAVTSGSSTPTQITREVIRFLEQLGITTESDAAGEPVEFEDPEHGH